MSDSEDNNIPVAKKTRLSAVRQEENSFHTEGSGDENVGIHSTHLILSPKGLKNHKPRQHSGAFVKNLVAHS